MRLILKFLSMVFALALFTQTVWALNFTASLDRDTITLGENATLSLTYEGGSPNNEPTPEVPGLNITWSGNSSSFKYDGNGATAAVTMTYTVTAQHTGVFTIPAFKAELGGQAIASQPLTLTVLRADAPSSSDIDSGNEVAFMTMVVPPGTLYVGQQLTAQLRIYLRDDVEQIENFQFTSQAVDGFLLGKSAQGGKSRARVGSRIYTVIPVTYTLTVTKSGPLALGPFTASAMIVVPSQNQSGGDPFFRQFFNQSEQKQVSLATQRVKVDAMPLPDQNKPANFSGAIGNFTMAVNIGPTNVTVGDPVTVHVQISGHGSFDSVTLPDQSALNGFKIFPPTVKTEPSDQLGMDGTKTFEEIVTPQNSDIREWPQFSFSFFNPDDGQYHTLTQPAVALLVHSAGTMPLPAFAKNSSQENQAPVDISPIKEDLGTLHRNSVPLVVQPSFLLLQSVPVLGLLVAFIWRKRADNLANNPRLRRQRAVAQIISNGLNELKTFAAGNKPDDFFATLFRLLQEQLGERLDCPASAITENVIDEHPVLRHAPVTTRDDLRELFQLCNQARYAPVRGSSELNSVAARFQTVIVELQSLKS